MPIAYVLITCNTGFLEEVLVKLKELSEVVEADSLYFGPYDIIVRVEAGTIEDLNRALGTELKKIANITSSVTLIKNEDFTT